MNLRIAFSTGRIVVIVALACSMLLATRHSSAQATAPQACSAPEYRQFDFWIGDWDAFEVSDPTTISAHIRIDPILGGCVLEETYEGANGAKGQSFSIYDRSRGVWHQTWLTNRGKLLVIEGKMQGGAMILTGSDRTVDGMPRLVRGIWKPDSAGVRETAATSTDNGVTWTPWFDLLFRAHAKAAK
ncbi:MAG: hypothetical protein ABR987_05430 [Terracidiphilus sp.]|jgi:hypothetical protein